MFRKRLGDSDMVISAMGIGTWAIGGDWAFGWGPQDDKQSIAAIREGIERGFNWIDTAPIYGLGHAEEVVARALDDLGSSRRPYVFTKCGLVWDEDGNTGHCLKADSIRAEVDASLRRLRVDALDLCQIHWPSMPPSEPAPDIEEAWTTLAELKETGKIRYIGVSNFDVAQLQRVQAIAPVTSLQPPYSMLMRAIEDEILPYCLDQNIGVIAYSPLHNGLLSGAMTRERVAQLPETDWRSHSNIAFQEPHLTANLNFVDWLRGLANRHGCSVGELAIAWTLRHPAVTAAIVGIRRPDQLDGIVGAPDVRLSDAEFEEIRTRQPESIEMIDRS